MARRKRLRPCAYSAAALAMTLTASCGSSPTPPPTPLSVPQLQSRYLAAAGAYNAGEVSIAQAENRYCGGTAADLGKCKTALEQDRSVTLAFDKALRAIAFPAAYRTAVSKLLQDDSQLEQTLQQAAAGSSLTADEPLFLRLSQLLVVASQDAGALRSALSLATRPPASPSPVA